MHLKHQRNECGLHYIWIWHRCMAKITYITENITCTFSKIAISITFWLEEISVLAISGQVHGI